MARADAGSSACARQREASSEGSGQCEGEGMDRGGTCTSSFCCCWA